jgi:hypothetical protein
VWPEDYLCTFFQGAKIGGRNRGKTERRKQEVEKEKASYLRRRSC